LEKQKNIPSSSAIVAVALDKLFEIIANFTFLLIGIFFIINKGILSGSNSQAVLFTGFLLIMPLIYLVALWTEKLPCTMILRQLSNWKVAKEKLIRLKPIISSSEKQISSLLRDKPLSVFWILLASGIIWTVTIAEYGFALNLLGAKLSITQIVIALTAARIAFLTPLPGGLGALEASQVLVMQALGFSPALGISISLIIRGRDLLIGIAGILLGVFFTQRTSKQPLSSQAGD
jgi:uncharacterized protein (TIRG00374 family)